MKAISEALPLLKLKLLKRKPRNLGECGSKLCLSKKMYTDKSMI